MTRCASDCAKCSAEKRKPIRTQAFHMDEPLINVDNVAEALAYLEGEGFK